MEYDKVFINFTNHPSRRWKEEQILAAKEYGTTILDFPFPEVDPCGDKKYIMRMAKDYSEMIMLMHPVAVLCQGEFCMTHQTVLRLQEKGVMVLSACSERIVEEKDGKKVSTFVFRGFREY